MNFRNLLGDSSGSASLEIDAVAELLSNSRRRSVLDALTDEETVEVGCVAEDIALVESGSERGQARRRVKIALHQSHLPKLDEHNVVEYDTDRKEVARAENFEEVLEAKTALENSLQ